MNGDWQEDGLDTKLAAQSSSFPVLIRWLQEQLYYANVSLIIIKQKMMDEARANGSCEWNDFNCIKEK